MCLLWDGLGTALSSEQLSAPHASPLGRRLGFWRGIWVGEKGFRVCGRLWRERDLWVLGRRLEVFGGGFV